MSLAPTEEIGPWHSTDPVVALSALTAHGFRNGHQAAQAIFGLIREIVGLRVCVLTRIDLEANTLTVLEAFDGAGVGVASGMVLPADSMPCGCVVRNGAALREFDLDAHPAFRDLPQRVKLGLRSYIGVPLRRGDGMIWGTLAATDTTAVELTDRHLQTLTVLARLAALEFEVEEQRDALAAQAKVLAERLEMLERLEEDRIRAARIQAVLEAAATVSHEVGNPLTVLQLRMEGLAKRLRNDPESTENLDVALEAAREINQVMVRLRSVVRPISTHYLSSHTPMLDLLASQAPEDGGKTDAAAPDDQTGPRAVPRDA